VVRTVADLTERYPLTAADVRVAAQLAQERSTAEIVPHRYRGVLAPHARLRERVMTFCRDTSTAHHATPI
jgi:hypothetical protein